MLGRCDNMAKYVLWDAATGKEVSKRYNSIIELRKNVRSFLLKHNKDRYDRYEVTSIRKSGGHFFLGHICGSRDGISVIYSPGKNGTLANTDDYWVGYDGKLVGKV